MNGIYTRRTIVNGQLVGYRKYLIERTDQNSKKKYATGAKGGKAPVSHVMVYRPRDHNFSQRIMCL